jgi:single-strand DNA-binding protein
MSGSLNRVQLIGFLGADPEIRRTQSGNAIANMRVATSETWRDKNSGEKREKTEWHTVVVFAEHAAKFAEQYLKKGSFVFVEGQLATRKWQDQNGNDRYSTEIVVQNFGGTLTSLDRSPANRPPASNGAGDYGYDDDRATGRSISSSRQSTGGFTRDMDDDIPF